MDFHLAPDIQSKINKIQSRLKLPHINVKNIVCFRSSGSRSRARARIWGFPRIWQMALNLEPHYCIEILSEKFDHLSDSDQTRVLIHELLHIPKNFSGALLPHQHRSRTPINHHTVEKMFKEYQS